jgi:hypothetical protein
MTVGIELSELLKGQAICQSRLTMLSMRVDANGSFRGSVIQDHASRSVTPWAIRRSGGFRSGIHEPRNSHHRWDAEYGRSAYDGNWGIHRESLSVPDAVPRDAV